MKEVLHFGYSLAVAQRRMVNEVRWRISGTHWHLCCQIYKRSPLYKNRCHWRRTPLRKSLILQIKTAALLNFTKELLVLLSTANSKLFWELMIPKLQNTHTHTRMHAHRLYCLTYQFSELYSPLWFCVCVSPAGWYVDFISPGCIFVSACSPAILPSPCHLSVVAVPLKSFLSDSHPLLLPLLLTVTSLPSSRLILSSPQLWRAAEHIETDWSCQSCSLSLINTCFSTSVTS